METEYHVGDKVKFLSEKTGTIVNIVQDKAEPYPIEVVWDNGDKDKVATFTEDGYVWVNHLANDPRLIVVHKAVEKDEEFKIGDWVFYPYFGMGTVIANYNDGRSFPVEVQWSHTPTPTGYPVSTFTKEGKAAVPLVADEDARLEHVPTKSMSDEEEIEGEGEEIMEDILANSAITPKHYRVEGIPEAIDIMDHLMTPEQFEGFLWGNILKYAYRYGRKGDKAETAGKIAWYADQLKGVEEWRTQNET